MAFRIEADRYYRDHELRIMGLDGEALERAREARELRCREVDGEPLTKGAWLIAWLDREPQGAKS